MGRDCPSRHLSASLQMLARSSKLYKMCIRDRYETVLPAQLPYDAEQLRQYDGVVLVNVDYDAADEMCIRDRCIPRRFR